MLANLTFVLGGAASGKSRYAEDLINALNRPKVYIATAQVWDDEMADKISAHRQSRGPDWITYETPLDPGEALANCTADQAVLIDCATLWLTNLVLGNHDVPAATDALCASIAECPAQIVIVSNEVGYGIVPENALSRRFREAQGRLNQRLAAEAATVTTVIAGLPLTLKGPT